ncbi:SDR family NAD(P)-dependent oxidoreductase [Streptomyces sp. NPDC001514]
MSESVTGSSSGIGAAVARRLAASGVRVVVNSARSVEAGKALAAELPDAGHVQADVAEEGAAAALVEAAVAVRTPGHPRQQRGHHAVHPARRSGSGD